VKGVHVSDPAVSDHSATAQECEEWARENPDDPEAMDALLDAAGEWAAGGDHGRALALYQEIQGGDRGRFGFVGAYIAEELFALGREVEARAVVTETRVVLDAAAQPDGDGYGLMADLLGDRGETEAALQWCEAGIARYCPHYRPDAVGENGYDATSAHLVSGRRMLREQLDLAPDALDVSVDAAGERVLRLLGKFAAAFGDRSGGRPHEDALSGLSLYWSKEDFVIVRARWPTIAADYGEDYPAYCLRVEGVTRALSEAG